jgi:hypothetical protein
VDLSTLRALATEGLGFDAVHGDDVETLSDWCWDWCEQTGDARFCSISRMLGHLDAWWTEHDESGGVPSALLKRIESVIQRDLQRILDATDPASGSVMARALRQEVDGYLLPPSEWEGWT